MFDKGLEKALANLFVESDIFEYEFEDDEWPSSHNCDHKMMRPYNATLFNLIKHYDNIFPDLPPLTGKAAKNAQMFKIVYKVNLLGTIAPIDDGSFIEILSS